MPMVRSRYPHDWELRARRVKERAMWRCEWCGKQCRRPGEPFDVHGRTLTTAHLDHDPWNLHARLAALCSSCHMRYDAHTRRNPAQLNWFLRFVAMTTASDR